MKILKVYDKINRSVFHSDTTTGNIFIKEYLSDNSYIYIVLNTKIFNSKNENLSYLSCMYYENNIAIESLELTSKYLIYKKNNKKGKVEFWERTHIKDNKSFLRVDRIYDEKDDFIESENHKGSRQLKYTIKPNIIEQLLKLETDGTDGTE